MVAAQSIDRVPFEQYVKLDGVHATGLKDMLVSPRLYKHRRDNPREDSDTLRVGRAVHTAVLEPMRFLKEYTLWRKSEGRRYGKKWDGFRAEAGTRTILTEDQYDQATRIADSVRDHPIASKYLSEPGKAELTIRWTHPRTGVGCVSRIDWLCSALVDLKTCRSPDPARFASDAAKYGYAMQLAFYGDAVAAAGLGAMPTKIIAAQKDAPHDVVVFDLPDDVLQIGREQYELAIDQLIECQRTGAWPGISNDEVPLRLPAWAVPEEEPIMFGEEQAF